MRPVDYFFLVGGILLLVAGVHALVKKPAHTPRHQAWGYLGTSAFTLLAVLSHHQPPPIDEWLQWSSTAVIWSVVIVQVVGNRRQRKLNRG